MAVEAQGKFNTGEEDDGNVSSTGPQSLGPQGGVTGGGAPGMAQPSGLGQGGARQGSGRFTNIQRYMNANQGAGERVAGAVRGAQEAELEPKATEAQTQAAEIGDIVERGREAVGAGQRFRDTLGSEEFDPTAMVNDQERFSQYQTFMGRGEGGDMFDLATAQQASDQAANAQLSAYRTAQQQRDALATEQGRFQSLSQAFNDPRYGTGAQTLDQVFLQQTPEAISGLQQAAADRYGRFSRLGEQLAGQFGEIQDIGAQEADLQAELTDATRNMMDAERSAVDEEIAGRMAAISEQGQQFNSDIDAAMNVLNDPSTMSNYSDDQIERGLQLMGLDMGTMVSNLNFGTIDSNLANRYSGNLEGVDAQEFKTRQQAERLNALAALAGMDDTFTAGQYADQGPTDLYGFNTQALASQIDAANRAALGQITDQDLDRAYTHQFTTRGALGIGTDNVVQGRAVVDEQGFAEDLAKGMSVNDALLNNTTSGGPLGNREYRIADQQARRRAAEAASGLANQTRYGRTIRDILQQGGGNVLTPGVVRR